MRNETPFIEVEGLRFLNVPSAQSVIDEIFRDDCYRISEIPDGCTVFDIGAFYGEFGIYMASKKRCKVYAFEPASNNFGIACINWKTINSQNPVVNFMIYNRAVTGSGELVLVNYRPEHPAGSQVKETESGGLFPSTKLSSIVNDVCKPKQAPICVKLDCEGSEVGIFRDDSGWIDQVDIVTMEFHNHDGDFYQGILEAKGFKVEVTGSGPKPRAIWDKSMTGGLLFAKR